jgi:hypothetical protein
MWSRAVGLSDAELTDFTIEQDLIEVRSGAVSYGAIILGKIRIPAVNDELGLGYVHVRCVGQCRPLVTPGRRPHAYQRMGVCRCRYFRSYFHTYL